MSKTTGLLIIRAWLNLDSRVDRLQDCSLNNGACDRQEGVSRVLNFPAVVDVHCFLNDLVKMERAYNASQVFHKFVSGFGAAVDD